MLNKVFVSIASYRDPELIPTLTSLFYQAKHPANLVVGIAWQHSLEDSWDNWNCFPKEILKIIDIPYDQSRGVCWARSEIQKLYNGEKYTLQIDSHHRFVQDWDEQLINMIEDLKKKGYEKPLLTTYVPSYDPENDPDGRNNEPWWLMFDRFIPEGAVFTQPGVISDWQNMQSPIYSRFISAHFIFTLGQFNKEILYDPNLYFHGEEISLAVRAYTNGYDLFHPHKVILWHEYTRKNRVKHWDDDKSWGNKNNNSHLRNRKLFGMDDEKVEGMGIFGFGKQRTLEQYEQYAGIRFSDRSVQKYTLDNNFAPNPPGEYERVFKHCIDLSYESVSEKDYEFWAVVFEDKDGNCLYRKDADKEEIQSLYNDPDRYIKLWREFHCNQKPYKWVVWPFSTSKQWCDRIVREL